MTKWNKARALESESDPALISFVTLSKIPNSTLYSSVKWEQKTVATQCLEQELSKWILVVMVSSAHVSSLL